MQLVGQLVNNIGDYVQTLYGTPPPENTNPDFFLVNEKPIDWRFVRRTYVQDRVNEDTYNASISYSSEANDYPIFTRDYIIRRSVYAPRTKLTRLSGLINATVVSGGSGYTQATVSVTLSGGTGSGGAVTAIVSNGAVVMLVITAEGNYTVAPSVTINDSGTGVGATGTVAVQPATALLVKEDYIRTPESELDGLYVLVRRVYETLPGPILTSQDTDELTGIVTRSTKQLVASGTVSGGVIGGAITSLTISNAGSGFTAGTYNLGFSGGGGTGAAGTYTVTAPSPAGKLASVTVTNGGGGYTSAPSFSITGGGGSGATGYSLLVGAPIDRIDVSVAGSGYTDVPTAVISDSNGGAGSGAFATVNLTSTSIGNLVVDAGGSGYATVTIIIGAPDEVGGTQATATGNLTGDVLTSITITDAGSGYTHRPTVSVTGDGTGATAHSELTGTSVASFTVSSTGFNYQSPQMTLDGGGGGMGAVGTPFTRPQSVGRVVLTAVGSGYSSPTLTFTGGGGSAATATVALATGTITSVSLTNGGSGYVTAPTITTPSGGGTGAVVSAILAAISYRKVEALTTCKDLVITSFIDLTTLPAVKRFPVTFRVDHGSFQFASLDVLATDDGVDVGLNETTLNGGSGPALAWMDEYYMTDSQYAAFNAGVMSVTGRAITTTLTYEAIAHDIPRVWTFRTTPYTEATSSGVLDISSSQKPFGLRKVVVISLP